MAADLAAVSHRVCVWPHPMPWALRPGSAPGQVCRRGQGWGQGGRRGADKASTPADVSTRSLLGAQRRGRTVESDFRRNVQEEDSRPHSMPRNCLKSRTFHPPQPAPAALPPPGYSVQGTRSRCKCFCGGPAAGSLAVQGRRAGQQAGPVPSAHAGAQECPGASTYYTRLPHKEPQSCKAWTPRPCEGPVTWMAKGARDHSDLTVPQLKWAGEGTPFAMSPPLPTPVRWTGPA